MNRMWEGLTALLFLYVWCSAPAPLLAGPPAPSVKHFDVNDVSYLWPVPATKADVDALISADFKTADGSPLWPARAFDAVIARAPHTSVGESTITFDDTFAEDFKRPSTWKVAGFRVDPSAPGAHDQVAAKFGRAPQLRFVLQPVTVDSTGHVRVHDFAAHLVFNYVEEPAALPFKPDRTKFEPLLNALAEVKAKSPMPTAGPLKVHPGLSTKNPAFIGAVKEFVKTFASPSRGKLFAISFMGVMNGAEPWIFNAMKILPDGTVADSQLPTLGGKSAQALAMLQLQRVQPAPAFLGNVDPVAGKGVSTRVLFADDAGTKLQQPAIPGLARPQLHDIPDIIANPNRANFFNTDCVSCHSESTRRALLKTTPVDAMFHFAPPTGISGVDPTVLPGTERWNVRNFGWFQRFPGAPIRATITMRTAGESAESADFINRDYFNTTPNPSPGDGVHVQLMRASLHAAADPRSTSRTRKDSPMPEPVPVASPLTLVMDSKSPQDHAALKALVDKLQSLPPGQNPIAVALTKLKTVHFARFVFLNDHQMAVITTYDGRFEDYIDSFVNTIGPIFDQLLSHMKDAPPLPVAQHRFEFLEYVKQHDLTCVPPFYSAYPWLSVKHFLGLQKQAAAQP
jgi:hypothetical protein